MKFDYEKFVEKAYESGMADEFESKYFKNMQNIAMKRLDELNDKLLATLTTEQHKLIAQIEEYENEYDYAIEKQAFYKGYMLAISFFSPSR